VLLGKSDKFIHVWYNGFDTALHGGDGIRLALQAHALTIDGAKLIDGNPGRPSPMITVEIATKDKYFIGQKRVDMVRGIPVSLIYAVWFFVIGTHDVSIWCEFGLRIILLKISGMSGFPSYHHVF